MKTKPLITILLFALFLMNGCQKKENKNDWPYVGGDLSNSKFSSLDYINISNIAQLKQVWQYEENDEKDDSATSLNFTPLVVKGKMISFMPSRKLVALDPSSGKLLWEFTPDKTEIATWIRGATFKDGFNGEPDMVLFVYGSTLYSINANDGKLNSSFGENGKVDFYEGLSVKPSMREKVHVTANAPGVIFNDLFIIGCKVPDELPSTPGDIRAFNANTGKLEWIFHTIPQKGEFGADTWPENAREIVGGANCWGSMTLDKDRGIIFVPTASPSFDFYGANREGQNLFANCLLALNAKTGERIWHFQTTHHDLWDRDNGSAPNLVNVIHEGKSVDAVALVTKLGYVFLFNRETGKPLFPIEELPVPATSKMPGEKPWPTQPFPTKPPPFARQGYKQEYITNIDSITNTNIKKKIAENGYDTGIYDPPNLNGSIIVPSAHGGANWGGASYNPNSGVLFVNSHDMPWFLKLTETKNLQSDNHLKGEELYSKYCSACHGLNRMGTSYGPDITNKVNSSSVEYLDGFIKRGAEPMPSFKHLPQVQIDAIISYIRKQEMKSDTKVNDSELVTNSTEPYGFSGYSIFFDDNGLPAIKPPFGTLNAIDLNKGEIIWQVPLGEDPKLAEMGIKNSGMFSRGGSISTNGGLVFIAATKDGMFRAFEQASGKVLWETKLPGLGTANPATYAVDGKQYVVLAVSPSKDFKGGYVAFSLDQ